MFVDTLDFYYMQDKLIFFLILMVKIIGVTFMKGAMTKVTGVTYMKGASISVKYRFNLALISHMI